MVYLGVQVWLQETQHAGALHESQHPQDTRHPKPSTLNPKPGVVSQHLEVLHQEA